VWLTLAICLKENIWLNVSICRLDTHPVDKMSYNKLKLIAATRFLGLKIEEIDVSTHVKHLLSV